jgi:hypothetical protein
MLLLKSFGFVATRRPRLVPQRVQTRGVLLTQANGSDVAYTARTELASQA